MLVAFWGPVHGQVRTTSNMVAVASMMALDYPMRILITHTHFERSTLEAAYSKLRQRDYFRESAGGWDGLQRLAQCGMLEPESVRDNAEAFLKDRLDMLAGPGNQDAKTLRKVLPHVLASAKRFYDLAFIDISSGIHNELSQLVMQQADLIVVNLNQNTSVLERFFSKEDWLPEFDGKKLLYCIGSYERFSRITQQRISKSFGVSMKQIGAVPYNPQFMDSLQENALQFILTARSEKKQFLKFNEKVYFRESVRAMGKRLLQGLEMMPMMEAELYD